MQSRRLRWSLLVRAGPQLTLRQIHSASAPDPANSTLRFLPARFVTSGRRLIRHVKRVNLCSWCLFTIALTLQLQGEELERPAQAKSRRAVLDGFKFSETPKPIDAREPILEKAPSADDVPPDIVVMKRYDVKERKIDRELAADIKKTRPLGPQSESKWGTGVHQKDFGKTRVSVVTILYVPVLINASW